MYKHNGFIADPVNIKAQQVSWALQFLGLFAQLHTFSYQTRRGYLPRSPHSLRGGISTPDLLKIFPSILLGVRSRGAIKRISHAIGFYGDERRWFTGQFDLINCERPFLAVFALAYGIGRLCCISGFRAVQKPDGNSQKGKSKSQIIPASSRRFNTTIWAGFRIRNYLMFAFPAYSKSHLEGFLFYFRQHPATLAGTGIAISVIVFRPFIYRCNSEGHMRNGLLTKVRHLAIKAEQPSLFSRQTRFLYRDMLASEHIENINPLIGECRQIFCIWASLILFIFHLGIGLDSANCTKEGLGQTKPFTLFTQPAAD